MYNVLERAVPTYSKEVWVKLAHTHTRARRQASRQVSFVGDKTGELEMSLVFLLLLCVIPFLATSGMYSLFLSLAEVPLSLLLRLIVEIALQYHWRVYQVSSIRIPIETVSHRPIGAATSYKHVITRLSLTGSSKRLWQDPVIIIQIKIWHTRESVCSEFINRLEHMGNEQRPHDCSDAHKQI